jgi:hypothetical protein
MLVNFSRFEGQSNRGDRMVTKPNEVSLFFSDQIVEIMVTKYMGHKRLS